MKFFLLTLFAISLIIGCNQESIEPDCELDYEISKGAAIDAWESVIGEISDDCLQHVDSVVISELNDITTMCKTEKNLNGCMRINTNLIYIELGRDNLSRMKTAAHEYIHHIEFCYLVENDWVFEGEFVQYDWIMDNHYNLSIWDKSNSESVLNLSKTFINCN